MFEELIAFFLGFISVFSPCVIPVLPIIFAGTRFEIKNSISLFTGLTLSVSLLTLTSILISGLRILACLILLFFSIYLLSDRIEVEISRRLTFFAKITDMKLPSFILGFFLPFLWLPCIAPFLGIAISEAVLSEKPLIVSLFYVLGFSSAFLVIVLFGKSFNIRFERIRKIFGILVLISAIYLIPLYL